MRATVPSVSIFRSILNTATETVVQKLEAANATKRSVTKSRLVRASPAHFYEIVCNVNDYSKFLPFCSHSKVLRHSPCRTMFDAVLTIGYPPFFTETYVSRVTMGGQSASATPLWTVQTKSLQTNIVQSISSTWKIYPVLENARRSNEDEGRESHPSQHCNVELMVEMQVNDPLIISVLDQVLEKVATQQVEAFEKRANNTLPRGQTQ